MTSSQETTFSIKTTAQMVDMNTHTIRAWERRYKALDPSRNQDNNRREYNISDIERLNLLATLVKAGHQISHIAGLSTSVLKSMIQSTNGDGLLEHRPTECLILDRCISALERYDIVLIHAELESARHFLSASAYVTELAIPLVREVGRLVTTGQLNIAQEHALSSVLRAQLLQTLFNIRNSIAVRAYTRKDQAPGLSVCLATREGDLHEFGILAASILVASHGHIPHYFGPNLPARALADAANAVQAAVVMVGNSQFMETATTSKQEAYLRELSKSLHPQTKIWWCGNHQIKQELLLERSEKIETLEQLVIKIQDPSLLSKT